MTQSDERRSANGGWIDDVDREDQISDGGDSVGAETPETAAQSVTRMLVADGDGDLLMQREDDFLQWLGALDMQVMGACREDERLKPLLKLNVSAGVAEDGLLAHLNQHFEPSEVGLLARCLCVPLVSIRVGKISKQGSVMSPTSVRGNLCLALLPTSELRILFNGDDGSVERIATLSTEVQCTAVQIEEIPADMSGRSFLIKTSDSAVSYFWCSEKSKLLGDGLLRKMNDLLMRKPSLAELTGISESRLSYFASHLRAYLTDTMISNVESASILSANPSENSTGSSELHSSQSSFNLSAREKPRREFENCADIDGISLASSDIAAGSSSSTAFQTDKLPEVVNGTRTFAAFNILDVFGKPAEVPISVPEIQTPSSNLSLSPQYCWCPIGNPEQLPISSSEPFSLPPLSSLLSSSRPSGVNVAELPPLNFPVRFQSSQQIPTFTPLICDPIVHIPVIDVCSSGQGYLVSSGLGMTTSIPLGDKIGESTVEKSARETLRMLISNQNNGTRDVIGMTDSMSSMGLVLFSEKSTGRDDQKEASGGGPGSEEGMG